MDEMSIEPINKIWEDNDYMTLMSYNDHGCCNNELVIVENIIGPRISARINTEHPVHIFNQTFKLPGCRCGGRGSSSSKRQHAQNTFSLKQYVKKRKVIKINVCEVISYNKQYKSMTHNKALVVKKHVVPTDCQVIEPYLS